MDIALENSVDDLHDLSDRPAALGEPEHKLSGTSTLVTKSKSSGRMMISTPLGQLVPMNLKRVSIALVMMMLILKFFMLEMKDGGLFNLAN